MTSVGLAYATLFPALIILLDGSRFGLKASHDETHESENWEDATLSRFKRVAVFLLVLLIPIGAWCDLLLILAFSSSTICTSVIACAPGGPHGNSALIFMSR